MARCNIYAATLLHRVLIQRERGNRMVIAINLTIMPYDDRGRLQYTRGRVLRRDDVCMCMRTYATTELCHLILLRPVKFRVAELLASGVEEIRGREASSVKRRAVFR